MKFDAIRYFYEHEKEKILAARCNEWAFSPYAWNEIIEMTPIELAIWERIRNVNAVFYPQYPVGRYFADFGNPVAKVAIECDGKMFHLDKERDAKRDKDFAEMGWDVYRIPGRICMPIDDCEEGFISEATKIIESIASRHGVIRNRSGIVENDESMNQYIDFLLSVK